MQPVLLPVPQVKRWQLLMFLLMLSLLRFTLLPLSGMLPTLLMPILLRPKNVIGNINTYSD